MKATSSVFLVILRLVIGWHFLVEGLYKFETPWSGEAYLRAPRMAQYAGGFLAGVYEPLTRVDAAGHCLSAMVTIERERLR